MSTPVIGLDRDGTINEDIGLTQEGVPPYCIKPEQFKPIPGSLEAIKMIRDKGYDVVILTNQSGIQKGLYDAVFTDGAVKAKIEELDNRIAEIDKEFKEAVGKKAAKDPNSRLRQARRRWRC